MYSQPLPQCPSRLMQQTKAYMTLQFGAPLDLPPLPPPSIFAQPAPPTPLPDAGVEGNQQVDNPDVGLINNASKDVLPQLAMSLLLEVMPVVVIASLLLLRMPLLQIKTFCCICDIASCMAYVAYV